jgi:hypothetical protein
MILVPPCDGRLRLVHVLELCRHDRVHFSVKLVVVLHVFPLSDEDLVLLDVGFLRVVASSLSRLTLVVLIPLPFSRLAQRWPRQLVISSLQVSRETALARSVACRLARDTVEFARLIKHYPDGVLVLVELVPFVSLAAARSP